MKIIRTKKKTISVSLLAASFLFPLVGCNEVLDDVREFNEGSTQTTDDGVSPSALNTTVLNIYQLYRQTTQLNELVAPAWAGDDITTTSSKNEFVQFDSRDPKATNPRLLNSWNNLSELLARINIQIDKVNEFKEQGTFDSIAEQQDLALVNELLAELIVLRSNIFLYFTRVHGKAPLQIDINTPVTTLSSAAEVFEQIEKDLLTEFNAIGFLNDKNSNSQDDKEGAVRVNKGSAQALLARVYMDWAGFYGNGGASIYAKAAEQAKAVIDNAGNYGFELLPNFEDLWRLENRFNNEMVFGLVFDSQFDTTSPRGDNRKYGQVGFPSDGVLLDVEDDCTLILGDNGRPVIIENAPFGGWDETFAEIRFFEDFPEQPRKDGTFRRDLDCFWFTQRQVTAPLYTKITGPAGDLSDTVFSTSRSDFWIRYADVLLMYAEASGRSGNETTEAWEALNQVVRRAWALPVGVPSARDLSEVDGELAELAFTERKWEFAGEFLRWFDLVRMDRVEEALGGDARTPRVSTDVRGRLLNVNNLITGDLSSANYFAPIPNEVLASNPGFGE